MKKVVLLSGGLDSAVCLACALKDCKPEDVLALNAYYGQRHDKEIHSAHNVAKFYGVELMEVDLSVVFGKSNCSLLKNAEEPVPEGSYEEQQKEAKGRPVSTYVPFRNGLMLSVAASVAYSVGATEICYGAHADDAAGNAYPDCSVEFTEAMNKAIMQGTDNKVSLVAPFVDKTKAEVVKEGLACGVPFELTWSCYNGRDKPCGTCGTCIDREKAFKANGVKDPLL